jgi:DNA-binding MarR family transcriptional regulator
MTSPPATRPDVEALVRQLYGLGRVRREISRHALAELGSQGFSALAAIHIDGPLRVSAIAAQLGVDLSVASRQVAALVRSGYVERRPDEDDGRAHRVVLTPEGEQAVEDAHRRMVTAFATVLEGWGSDDLSRLTRAIERLRTDFSRAAEGAPA